MKLSKIKIKYLKEIFINLKEECVVHASQIFIDIKDAPSQTTVATIPIIFVISQERFYTGFPLHFIFISIT